MSDVTVSIDLDASAQQVWDTVEPIERHVDWMADAESIRFDSEQTRGVGTTFRCLTKVGPIRLTDHMTITRWDPVRADDPAATVGTMGVEHHGVVTGDGMFTIEPIDDHRCRFTWSEDLTFPWYLGGRLGAVVGAKIALGPIWRRNLRRLRAIVEDDTRSSGSRAGGR